MAAVRLAVLPLLAALGALLAVGCGGAATSASSTKAKAKSTAAAQKPVELPGGGRRIFPGHRVVGFYGHPSDDELGELGIGSPASAGRRLLKQVKPYQRKSRPVLPAMELLASVATSDAGPGGDYSRRTDNATIRRYLKAARKIKGILILDIQPGRARFMPEVKRLQRWLKQPDVSLALDPEWHVGPGELPGQTIGSVDASDVNDVSEYLDKLTQHAKLPQKLLLIHQFTDDMIRNKRHLRPRRSLAITLNVDGFGSQEVKTQKYRAFAKDLPWTYDGFKLFYKEDSGLMSPRSVLKLHPPPDVVVYE